VTTKLGSYELGTVLGRGAMGVVYQATSTSSRTPVAVKTLRPELAADPDLIARFIRERSILCEVVHPNLVQVRDLVVEGGSAAIVMDLVPGSDLRRILKERGTVPPAEAAHLVQQLMCALEAVHTGGIVHRDVKPENVLIGSDGMLRLSDFGIARLTHGPSLTRMSGLIGTPEYLAPELADGMTPTPAADIYAVGILFYELLTGFTPFSGGLPVAVLRRHLDETPPRPENLPDQLWQLIAAMLHKRPEDRPGTAEVGRVLQSIAPSLVGLPALTPARPERNATPTTIRGRLGRNEEPSTILRDVNRPIPASTAGAGWFQRRRKALMASSALLVAVIAVAATAFATGLSGNHHRTRSYAFAPQSYPSGLIVDRTWTLSGAHGDHLRGAVQLSNGGSNVLRTFYDEVIPKSVAPSIDGLSLDPAPARIVKADPVVRYQLDLTSGSAMTFGYDVQLSRTRGSWSSRLSALANDQVQAQRDYLRTSGQRPPSTLTTLTTAVRILTLTTGQTATIPLAGKMNDGTPAPAAALAGVGWSSDDTAVAIVVNGLVTAVRTGETTVNAQAGSLLATVHITVSDRATLAATAPAGTVGAVSTAAGGSSRSVQPSNPYSQAPTPRGSAAPASQPRPGPSVSATVTTPLASSSEPGPTTSPPRVRHPIAMLTSLAVSTGPPCPSATVDAGGPTCGITFSYSVGPSDVAISNIDWWTDTAQNPQNVPNASSCTGAPCKFNDPGLTPGDRGLPEMGSFTDTSEGDGWLDVISGQTTCIWVTLTFTDGLITTSQSSCTSW
jgi:serine/threonine protein kinase